MLILYDSAPKDKVMTIANVTFVNYIDLKDGES
jgi:hypothetical protein